MRCALCDASDVGLSNYLADPPIASHFHRMPNGDLYCNECYSWDEEVTNDYYEGEDEE